MTQFDRHQLKLGALADRRSYTAISEVAVYPPTESPVLAPALAEQVAWLVARIRVARERGKPVMLTFGAHAIKNGLGPLIIAFMKAGWLTHLATNGAGSIHDWEFAYQGRSSEDVRENVARGEFGTWEETGCTINLAIATGAADGLGYGWSVGRCIEEDGFALPSPAELRFRLAADLSGEADTLAAHADLLALLDRHALPAGRRQIAHPYRQYSAQAAAYRLGIPFTVHPGIGYDIIYTHPMNSGGAIGRAAVRDFLTYADSVRHLGDGGVHLSVGSAIMAPMIFEKSLSMANNLALQETGVPLKDYTLAINDLQPGGDWDWRQGEPPKDHPAYYLRFCKSFYRMGGELTYLCLDNREFLKALAYGLL